MKHSYGKKLKLKSKATPNKKPISTQRGNDNEMTDMKIKKSAKKRKLENIKF